MKAAVIRGPLTMKVEDRPMPAFDEHGVLVRVRAAGICGSDIHGFLGAESGDDDEGQDAPERDLSAESTSAGTASKPESGPDPFIAPAAVNPEVRL